MKKLPIELNLSITETQQGALLAKANIKEIFRRLDAVSLDGVDENNYQPILFEARTKIISELVGRLGSFNQTQIGFISSLLEFAEIYSQTEDNINSWLPSLVTGKWN